MKHPVYIIVAVDEKNGIGKNGQLPWHFKKEFQYFRNTTTKTSDPKKQNLVIMGRKTWEALPAKYQPLPNRKNIVITRQKKYPAKDAEIAHSLDEAIQKADRNIENIFVLGGAEIFEQAINHPALTGIYLTKIHHLYDCDTFFSAIPKKFSQLSKLGKEQEEEICFEYLKLLVA